MGLPWKTKHRKTVVNNNSSRLLPCIIKSRDKTCLPGRCIHPTGGYTIKMSRERKKPANRGKSTTRKKQLLFPRLYQRLRLKVFLLFFEYLRIIWQITIGNNCVPGIFFKNLYGGIFHHFFYIIRVAFHPLCTEQHFSCKTSP